MDLTPLRPRADTPDGMIGAIARCTVAGRACLALIEKLKQERLGLLMSGHSDQLRMNAADTATAQSNAAEIAELLGYLETRLQQLAPEQVSEIAAQQRAVAAAAEMSTWWATNAALVTDSIQKMAVAFAALGELQAAMAQTSAVAEAARRAAPNVTPLRPYPAA